MVIMAPRDENEFRHMLHTAIEHNGPIAIRYPRGAGIGVEMNDAFQTLPIGKAEVLTEGPDILILAVGRLVSEALEAQVLLQEEGISATIVNCRFIKPLDEDLISALAEKIPRIITVEENVLQGGFGSAVLETLNDAGVNGYYLERLGISNTFVEHGPQQVLRSKYGVDAGAILDTAKRIMNSSRRLTAHL
jgi:1-deoxy-D-xylulose-5-phosphate synthase